ncbi:MAG: hypothetical protein HY319_02555 [Armatimonadetes bacterium]|nr:hypothetical protein [Armatimonadota bacterium]
MQINLPVQTQAPLERFRQSGSFGPGAQREEFDRTVVGGAGFVLATTAQLLIGADEMEGYDAARGKPGYVEFTPQAIKESFGADVTGLRVEYENGASPVDRTINAELTTPDGQTAFKQITTSNGVITSADILQSGDGYVLEGIYVGDGQAWGERIEVGHDK